MTKNIINNNHKKDDPHRHLNKFFFRFSKFITNFLIYFFTIFMFVKKMEKFYNDKKSIEVVDEIF